ncbi:MAG: tRNA (guanosine(46)-N7)-methyltransferase TrmB [Clostridia bacterium]|nr:tRNA (guanosine(46)-N7)-methyltransferase TrmB [Clostridia bacterium]
MRMRKKKHTEDRMVACGDMIITEPSKLRGKWLEFSEGLPLSLEIGCGKGTFVCETAKKHPEKFFIAVEKVRDVLVMAVEKSYNAELKNVVFADIDAAKLEEVFEEGELSEIYLNFSDPWPKKKHAKRRLTYRTFLDIYRKILKDDGAVFFKTDNRPLFDFSLEEMAECRYSLSDITYDLHNSEYNADNVVTEYEANFSAKGFTINRVVARPNGASEQNS